MELFDVQSAILEAEYGTEEREQLREIEKEIEHEMAVIFFRVLLFCLFFIIEGFVHSVAGGEESHMHSEGQGPQCGTFKGHSSSFSNPDRLGCRPHEAAYIQNEWNLLEEGFWGPLYL